MMYINKNLRLLLAKLHSLTPLELEKVQEEINSISVRKIPFFLSHQHQEQFTLSSFYDTFFGDSYDEINSSSLHGSTRLISSSTNHTLDNELKVKESVTKSPRPLGIWKGQVEISDEFYKTSSDILSELGIEE